MDLFCEILKNLNTVVLCVFWLKHLFTVYFYCILCFWGFVSVECVDLVNSDSCVVFDCMTIPCPVSVGVSAAFGVALPSSEALASLSSVSLCTRVSSSGCRSRNKVAGPCGMPTSTSQAATRGLSKVAVHHLFLFLSVALDLVSHSGAACSRVCAFLQLLINIVNWHSQEGWVYIIINMLIMFLIISAYLLGRNLWFTSFAFLIFVNNRMCLYSVYIIIDRLPVLPVEPEIKRKVVTTTHTCLLWTSFQYLKAANSTRELEDCEQANKLGAINSTLR